MKANKSRTVLYQKSKLGKTQIWSIWVEEKGKSGFPEVWIEHGQLGGKLQTTFDVVKSGVNLERANATNALAQAYLEMQRKTTKQLEQGYLENVEGINKDTSIDFSNPLPKSLCFFKPKTSCDDKKLAILEKNNQAIFSVKRDGLMHIIVSSDLGPRIYSRRMDDASGKFPHLISALAGLPKKTILLGEIIYDINGRDDFRTCCSICRSDDALAVQKQAQKKVSYYVFDIAFLNGVNLLTTMPFIERRKVLLGLLKGIKSEYVFPSEIIYKTHAEAMAEVKARKLEGLVIYDANGVMAENECYSLNGKAARPNVLWKSKPVFEGDFICRLDPDHGIGEWGTGKNKGKMKSVFLYQIDESGKESFICKCGGGFIDSDRDKFTNLSLYPRVFQIEFSDIMTGTGALRFPVFIRDREDKGIEECLLDPRIKAAREAEAEEEE
jgi:ATP-dependent DNA ligase